SAAAIAARFSSSWAIKARALVRLRLPRSARATARRRLSRSTTLSKRFPVRFISARPCGPKQGQDLVPVLVDAGIADARDLRQADFARALLLHHLRQLFVGENGIDRHGLRLSDLLAPLAEPGEHGEFFRLEDFLIVHLRPLSRAERRAGSVQRALQVID